MKVVSVKQKLILSALTGAILISGSAMTVRAEDKPSEDTQILPVAGIESVLKDCYKEDVKKNIDLYLVQDDKGEYLNRAFSNVSDYVYIRSAPDETSDWTGKLYSNSAADVLEYNDDWTKIRSGSAEGYVPATSLFTGKEAEEHAGEYEQNLATVTVDVLNVRDGQNTSANIVTQVTADQQYEVTGEAVNGWYPVKVGETAGWVFGDYVNVEQQYCYAESKEEEEKRIAAEEAAKAAREAQKQQEAQEAAVIQAQASSGQAVIDYACQFIGNPYVWGGTSLTDGADCSGFVQSVYAHFGISLPRTTWDMESVGTPVNYEEAVPGDIVLYDGHVGLYMGDGNIVNAMNEADGIGVCSATYTPIITVRRVL
ncbi:C40 family peptidase [Clostridium sp. C105KSO13]|uniref:C40 family peptidase n=1 Tax=Clostridium sp. C105KSO13 TaxID=1776045 RepID=UPI0007407651|nr:NlpC/P60 family protein [Clostridium sp. C105KSO13]CUX36822.1 putative endopeptidase precursor [Clostridium sp. C105KSO13]